MNTDLSLAILTCMPSGSDAVMAGSTFWISWATSSEIGGCLLDHADRDRRLAVEANDAPLIEGAELGVAHVCEAHEITIGLFDDEIVELLGRAKVGFGKHGELALLAFDAA